MRKPALPKLRVPVVPISPISLACPFCDAKPGKVCHTLLGGELQIVHVLRPKAAVLATKKARKRLKYLRIGGV